MVDAVVYYGNTSDRIASGDTSALQREYGAELARRRELFTRRGSGDDWPPTQGRYS